MFEYKRDVRCLNNIDKQVIGQTWWFGSHIYIQKTEIEMSSHVTLFLYTTFEPTLCLSVVDDVIVAKMKRRRTSKEKKNSRSLI